MYEYEPSHEKKKLISGLNYKNDKDTVKAT